MAKLKEEGKVRWIGVSNFNVAADGARPHASRRSPRCSRRTPAISPEIEDEILPYCQQHNIGVIVYSPMKSGLLTGEMTKERVAALPARRLPQARAWPFRSRNLSRNLELARAHEAHRRSATAAAPAKSPSPGRCAIRPSPPRSSACAPPSKPAASSARSSSA